MSLKDKSRNSNREKETNSPILVAAAWPYANGSLHMGHVASLMGADILARYFRLRGSEVLFVSGSDCHGTPIAVSADIQGVAPAVIASTYHEEFVKTLLEGLSFSYDLYTKTTTDNHREVVQEVFLKLHKEGLIYPKTEELPFCTHCNRFLPDRYMEGECPVCHFANARGDQCDECGTLLDPKELINPRCKICGHEPEWRPSEHFFLKLSAFNEELKKWIAKAEGWRLNAKNLSLGILEEGLKDRAITRDTEWGVPIPLPDYDDKRIYVWFEAVCGYFSASKEWAKLKGDENLWERFWKNEEAIHYYVHGKDNIPFHTIIWPAILSGYGGLHLPDRIVSSEYLTLEGKQFSKSRHWAVWLPDFLRQFDSETLRYFLIANGPETNDADFSWNEYRVRTNGELIGNFGNFVHRSLSQVKVNFPQGLDFPEKLDKEQEEFLRLAEATFKDAGEAIAGAHFREGLKIIFRLAEHGNRFLNEVAPWKTVKTDKERAARDLAVVGHVIKCLAILINPYLPKTSEKVALALELEKVSEWRYPLPNFLKIGELEPLYKKIEEEEIKEQIAKLGKEE